MTKTPTTTTKSEKLRAAWRRKREAVAQDESQRLTKNCPAWLRPAAVGAGRFEVIPERANIVQRVFEWALEGIGPEAIARKLNAENVQTFGGAKAWRRSYVAKLLKSRAVLGELVGSTAAQPKASSGTAPGEPQRSEDFRQTFIASTAGQDPGANTTEGEESSPRSTAEGYFPAIIERTLFESVQHVRAPKSRPRTDSAAVHVLTGLARCPECKGPMTRSASSEESLGYLMCTRAKAPKGKRTCANTAVVAVRNVEEALLKVDSRLLLKQGIPEDRAGDDDDDGGELTKVRDRLLKDVGGVLEKIDEVTAELDRIEEELRRLEEELQVKRSEKEDLERDLVGKGGQLADAERELRGLSPKRELSLQMDIALERLMTHRKGPRLPMEPRADDDVVVEQGPDGSAAGGLPTGYKAREGGRSEAGKGQDPEAVALVNAVLRELVSRVVVDSRALRFRWRRDPGADETLVPLPTKERGRV